MPSEENIALEAAARANGGAIAYFKERIPELLKRQASVSKLATSPYTRNESFVTCFNLNAEDYINHGFLDRLGLYFKDDDLAFVKNISQRFERVKYGFAFFTLLSDFVRPFENDIVLEKQLRVGWQRVGIPTGFNQTVAEHQESCELLALLLFFDDPELDLLRSVLRHHDDGEGIIGDFTPHCDITQEEKMRIEALGLHFVMRHKKNPLAKRARQAFHIYEGKDSEYETMRIKAKDIDALEMALEAALLVNSAPTEEKMSVLKNVQPFWDHVDQKIKTTRARNFFHSLQTIRHSSLTHNITHVYNHAHQYMLIKDEKDIGMLMDDFENVFSQLKSEDDPVLKPLKTSRGFIL